MNAGEQFTLLKVGSVTVKLRNSDGITNMLARGLAWEPNTLLKWSEVCKDGKAGTIIDVGAYNGIFSIAAALLGNHAIALEPKPILSDRIALNAKANCVDITILEVAASDSAGTGILYSSRAAYSSMSTFDLGKPKPFDGYDRKEKRTEESVVKTIRLDSLDGIKGHLGAIKIDVEGHESSVIRGALDLISEHKPVLFVEVLDDEKRAEVEALLPAYRTAALVDGRNIILEPR